MGKRRREDPTMETELERWNPKLSAKYNNLVQQYMVETCRPSNAPDHNLLDRRHSTGSNGSVSIDRSLINKCSPRELMSSLQQKNRSPGSSHCMRMSNCKARANDGTVAQILMDRQSAFQSGTLKGRRLFQDTDDEDEELDGEEICSDCFDLIINEQVKSVVFSASDDQIINDEEFCCPVSSNTSSSSLVMSDDGKLVNREMVVEAVETEKSNSGKCDNGVRTVMHASMGIVLILFVIWLSCNGWYYMGSEDDAQVFLIPT